MYAVIQNARRAVATSIVYGEVMSKHRTREKAQISLDSFDRIHGNFNRYIIAQWSKELKAYILV